MIADLGSPPLESVGRFDWYSATVYERPARLIEILSEQLGGEPVFSKPLHGYKEGTELKVGDRTVATVWWGGMFEYPFAFASSDETDAFVEVVRTFWPEAHHVTRMDAAIDFDDGDGTFDVLVALAKDLAAGKRVDGDERKRAGKIRTRTQGDWIFQEHGRTLYLGSETSAVQVRVYEKGIEIREKAAAKGVHRDDVSLNLSRLEVQVRPKGPSRLQAAKCSPLEAFGFSEWAKELARRVLGENVPRVHIKERRMSDFERAFRHMCIQYRDHIMHAQSLAGSWEEFGRMMEQRMLAGANGGERPDFDQMRSFFGDRPF